MAALIAKVKAWVIDEFAFGKLIPSLAGGAVTGLISVTLAVAFAALLFSGELAAFIPSGIVIMLYGSIVLGVVIALASSFSGTVGSIQDSPLAILAIISTAIVSSMQSASSDEKFFTVVAAILITSFLTGVLFIVVGYFRLGELIRYIPFPVIGGFLAGTGLLLVGGGFSVMTNAEISITNLLEIFSPDIFVKWLPGAMVAIALIVLPKRYNNALIAPGILMGGVIVFYFALFISGTSIDTASENGWLLNTIGVQGQSGLKNFRLPDFSLVNWEVISSQIGNISVVSLVSVIAMLLNITGIEVIIKKDVDINHELKVAGVSNLLSGMGGSMVGYHALGDTALLNRISAKGRLSGIILGLVCFLAMIAGNILNTVFPRFLLGGLLLFLGLDFLITWVYEAWFKFAIPEYLTVISIMIVINSIGFLEGIGLGLTLAVILFVVDYSRTNIARHILTGESYSSHVDRPREHVQFLRHHGHLIQIIKLQGFIFFGTSRKLVDLIRDKVKQGAGSDPRFIVVDFQLINGLDSSAIHSFNKLVQFAKGKKIYLVFTHLSSRLHRQLEKEILIDKNNGTISIFRDLDHGLEWCENQLIELHAAKDRATEPPTLMQQLRDSLPASIDARILLSYFERIEVEKGTILIRQGEKAKGVYFLEKGQMTAELTTGSSQVIRLRKMRAGTAIGEIGLYLDRQTSATVMADEICTLYYLSAEKLEKMENESPELAAAFHRFIVTVIGERLVNTNETLMTLLD